MGKVIFAIVLAVAGVKEVYAVSWQQSQSIYSRLSSGSGPRLTASNGGELNAYNYGDKIVITRGLMSRTTTNEMAWVLSHELGHSAGNGSGWAGEFGADRYGVGLANSKGFNGCAGAKSFLRKLNEPSSSGHPASNDRIKRLPC